MKRATAIELMFRFSSSLKLQLHQHFLVTIAPRSNFLLRPNQKKKKKY